MGMTRIRGMPRISDSVGDIQNIIANEAEKVIIIRIIDVEESETTSSNCATSAERTDIRLPV